MRQMSDALKITAITGYSSFSKRINFVKSFLLQIVTTTANMLNNLHENDSTDLISWESDYKPKSLIIVIGATKELGSGFFSTLKGFLPKIFKASINTEIDCIAVGKSSKKALLAQEIKNINFNVVKEIKDLNFKQATEIANDIASFIFANKSKYSDCSVVNLRFKSLLTNIKNYKILFPLFKNRDIESAQKKIALEQIDSDFLIEQPISEIFQDLSQKLLSSSILYEIMESLTAESAARYLAMDKAVINADKCIIEMTLQMNKARQVLITKQITEIACYADL